MALGPSSDESHIGLVVYSLSWVWQVSQNRFKIFVGPHLCLRPRHYCNDACTKALRVRAQYLYHQTDTFLSEKMND